LNGSNFSRCVYVKLKLATGTMDLNATRLDLASTASEVEREWLAGVLARRYSLPQVSGSAAVSAGA
jgi:hypothetical protein